MLKEIYKCNGISEAFECLLYLERIYPKLSWVTSGKPVSNIFKDIVNSYGIHDDDEIILCIKCNNFLFFRTKRQHGGKKYISHLLSEFHCSDFRIYDANKVLATQFISKSNLLNFLGE